MPEVSGLRTFLNAGVMSGAQTMALDSHVHLYSCAALGAALSSGRDNLAAASSRAAHVPESFGLVLTENAGDHSFEGLASGRLRALGWQVRPVRADRAVLVALRERDDAELLLFAGCQIVTRERIEVLALCTRDRFSDGSPLHELLAELSRRSVPAVLPWGLGRWRGGHGSVICDLMSDADRPAFLLGDTAGRPRFSRPPILFRRAAANGIPILSGTDPVPLADAEVGIGEYGCLIGFGRDTEWPAAELRRQLLNLQEQPEIIGHRRGITSVLSQQMALRRRPVHCMTPSQDREA